MCSCCGIGISLSNSQNLQQDEDRLSFARKYDHKHNEELVNQIFNKKIDLDDIIMPEEFILCEKEASLRFWSLNY
jgi:hypothetical protein